ncbi:cytochrome d ubiquinol oxidase subunit II [Corynebacterium sp. CNCTC7651]|uniref:cytochrome d ubiquinol oxidase subunit II n=1 Tax=Corynebacterium sp. CNCTC7651 TaxID=2815361 RepID=UPI001F1BA307|nr:cytochrome d ubiquinol oxidase subunit II [Corynebacterium sp. CNCTC7651]UIZ91826.1 cytochrome d ubiquinol oxidase subunit II [Corynebacterium sp. CNCTC7651]
MDLQIIWFILIAFFFTGYFILEGFDFGVGMLLPFMKGEGEENDRRRTAAINTIGPVWDGNEVWLITAGAAIFAAFPEWYATLFSGFYLPLVLIVIGLILRGVAIEWRGKVDTYEWRRRCDTAIAVGSYLVSFLWGVAFTNIVRGVPLNENGRLDSFSDGFLGLLNPLGLLGGVAFVALFMLHGATFIGRKAHDPLRSEAHAIGLKMLAPIVLVGGGIYLLWVQLSLGSGLTWLPLALTVLALLATVLGLARGNDKLAFWSTTVAILGCSVMLFGILFPDVMPSTSAAFEGWTIYNASSSPYTLKIMTWAAVLLFPVVAAGQAWTYWQFRKRVRV